MFTMKNSGLFPSFIIASLQGGQIINEVASDFFFYFNQITRQIFQFIHIYFLIKNFKFKFDFNKI